MARTPIIRHHDLSKMTDRQLEQELLYLDSHAIELNGAILKQTRSIMFSLVRSEQTPGIPLWKMHEDYKACTDRIQAIVEELNYRAIQ